MGQAACGKKQMVLGKKGERREGGSISQRRR